jgi:hypothetical protein
MRSDFHRLHQRVIEIRIVGGPPAPAARRALGMERIIHIVK